ncbi:TPA: hypothetical protein HA265_01330 [Candidatus Woesearchaeota archaeon]|nr:hypothetical protein [Candidatus Woesearchaeota archaeon]
MDAKDNRLFMVSAIAIVAVVGIVAIYMFSMSGSVRTEPVKEQASEESYTPAQEYAGQPIKALCVDSDPLNDPLVVGTSTHNGYTYQDKCVKRSECSDVYCYNPMHQIDQVYCQSTTWVRYQSNAGIRLHSCYSDETEPMNCYRGACRERCNKDEDCTHLGTDYICENYDPYRKRVYGTEAGAPTALAGSCIPRSLSLLRAFDASTIASVQVKDVSGSGVITLPEPTQKPQLQFAYHRTTGGPAAGAPALEGDIYEGDEVAPPTPPPYCYHYPQEGTEPARTDDIVLVFEVDNLAPATSHAFADFKGVELYRNWPGGSQNCLSSTTTGSTGIHFNCDIYNYPIGKSLNTKAGELKKAHIIRLHYSSGTPLAPLGQFTSYTIVATDSKYPYGQFTEDELIQTDEAKAAARVQPGEKAVFAVMSDTTAVSGWGLMKLWGKSYILTKSDGTYNLNFKDYYGDPISVTKVQANVPGVVNPEDKNIRLRPRYTQYINNNRCK